MSAASTGGRGRDDAGAGTDDAALGARLERTILDLLAQRDEGKTICPSDAARAVGASDSDPEGWRDLMEPARQAAQRLVEAGEVVVTQHGEVVDLPTARGPVRIRKVVPGAGGNGS